MALMDDMISEPSNVVGVSSTGEQCITQTFKIREEEEEEEVLPLPALYVSTVILPTKKQIQFIFPQNKCEVCICLPTQQQSVSLIGKKEGTFTAHSLNRVKKAS